MAGGARRVLVVGVVAVLLATGLTSAPSAAGPAAPSARGSVHQVQAWDLTPGATVELLKDGVPTGAAGVADAQGAFIFGVGPSVTDDVAPGPGYTVREAGGPPSSAVEVQPIDNDLSDPDDDPPDTSLYDQAITLGACTGLAPTCESGYQYLETRDGTLLSITVRPPLAVTDTVMDSDADNRWPVVIDYSGYTPSNPGAEPPTSLLMRAAGYAVVGVNLRGTGCSGGAYTFFERLQGLDGYDVVEALARQDWVEGNIAAGSTETGGPQIGMVGVSFPGISQLFVGRTQPPSLAGLAPTSVFADSYRSILYPGGILNNGFAIDWSSDRDDDGEPAGQGWAADRISNGDTVCADNQELKLQATKLLPQFGQTQLFEPDPGWDLSPESFVDEFVTPTFLAGSFEDEQTGGQWSELIDDFDPDVLKRAVLYNGGHADPLSPALARDLLEFLDIYVGRIPPHNHGILRGQAPAAFASTFGEANEMPPKPFYGFFHNQAVAGYEAQPTVRVLWESGVPEETGDYVCTVSGSASPCSAGVPFPRFVSEHTQWPPAEATEANWFLGPDGALAETAPALDDNEPRSVSSYRYDNTRDEATNFNGGTEAIWLKDATYDWQPQPDDATAVFQTPAFTAETAYAGIGSADLWVRADAADVDLEILLTEIRPDGQETYIQSGWLRASQRAEAPGSTALDPEHLHTQTDPLPAGEFVPVRVELFPFAHVVRPGSMLRLTVSTPGGNRPFWHFDALDAPGATVDLGHSLGRPSALNLPEIMGVDAPDTLPGCGSLRGQPCRAAPEGRAPLNVQAVIETPVPDRTVALSWDPPPTVDPVQGYTVAVEPTGEEFAVGSATTTFTYEVDDSGVPPSADLSFTVIADFAGGAGPASSPSLEVPALNPFPDVAPGAWNARQVDWLADWEIVTGYPDGEFKPGRSITRGQFVQWLWLMLGRPAASTANSYPDVGAAAWNSGAVDWAAEAGVVVGYPDGSFKPNRSITRGQAAQWVWITAGSMAGSPPNPFTDVAASAWNATAVDWLADFSLVNGYPDATFRQNLEINRGQAAFWFFNLADEPNAWL